MGFLVFAMQKMEWEPNNERGGGEGKEGNSITLLSSPPFDSCSLCFARNLQGNTCYAG